MAINIAALTQQAFAIAKALVPDALPAVTIRAKPATVVDPETDLESTTWGITAAGVQPLAYANKNEREGSPVETNQKSFAIPASALGAPAQDFDQQAEIIEGGLTWNVYRVEPDPTGNLVIFHAHR